MGLLPGVKGYLICGAASALVAGLGGGWTAWKIQDGNIARLKLKHTQEVLRAMEKVRKLEAAQSQISDDVGAKHAETVERIRTITRTQIREVTKYVTLEADAKCVLPVGFVRVHDAAARGVSVAEVPDPAGRPDDAPADVACSAVATIVTENYGTFATVRQQLIDLQDWTKQQQAFANEHLEE